MNLPNNGLNPRSSLNPKLESQSTPSSVIVWLIVVAAMIVAIIMVGGITRLTGSGLSIVEWKPIAGILPPMSESEWTGLFEQYRRTPQYLKENTGMTLEGFKDIFFWEYWHRVLGRVIGIVFFIPFVWFGLRRAISVSLLKKLGIIFVLGGLQGALGWYMVASGLVDIPRVSHFRLAAHLSLALILLGALSWLIMTLIGIRRVSPAPVVYNRHIKRLRISAIAILALISIQIVWGAFTAGLRAGFGFNTFPDMNGHLVPPGLFALDGFWSNIFYNNMTVQFTHRIFGWLVLLSVGVFWVVIQKRQLHWHQKLAAHVLFGLVIVQFTLGIITLLSVVKIGFAVAHQVTAAFIVIASLALIRTLTPIQR